MQPDFQNFMNVMSESRKLSFWNADDLSVDRLMLNFNVDRLNLNIESADVLVRDVRHKLFDREGFVILRLNDHECHSDQALEVIANNLASTIGILHGQNEKGDKAYRVENISKKGEKDFRFSKTNEDSTMHNDCTYRDDIPKIVSLFCIRPAIHGGMSQICSGYSIIKNISKSNSNSIEQMRREHYFHRRGTQAKGESSVGKYPVISISDGRLQIRYLRPYIEFGYREVNIESWSHRLV